MCYEEMPTEEEHWHWGSSHVTGSLPVVGMDQRRSITFAAAFTCVPRNTKWYSYLQGANRNYTCTGPGHVEAEKEQETFRHRGVKKFQEAGFKALEASVELKTNEEKE